MMYRVAIPLNVPSHYQVLRYFAEDGKEYFYYEDDLMMPPDGMKAEVVQDWLNRGFLVERELTSV